MNKTQSSLLFLVLLLLLAACTGNQETTPTAEPLPATATTEPTVEPTIEPTAVPPTATLAPEAALDTLQAANWAFTVSDQPVLTHTDQGWDSGRIDPGAVIYHDGQYHMFRNGFLTWPGATAIGYAVSDDGLTWQEVSNTPILTSEDILWENTIAVNATSALVLDDGTWVLYFHTWHTNRAVLGEGSIGRATASAPQGPWTPDPEPVLRMNDDPTAWDGGQVSQASVLQTAEGFLMYYTGADTSGSMRIGLANSQDSINWQKVGPPILEPTQETWDSRATYQSRVVQTPHGYIMLYKTFGPAPISAYSLAFSTNGVVWEKYTENPILLPDILPNGISLEAPSFLYQDGAYHLFTEGITTSRSQTDIFLLRN